MKRTLLPIITVLLSLTVAKVCVGQRLKSGAYNFVAVVYTGNELYGYYEFYEDHDPDNPNRVYFYGKPGKGDTVAIHAGYPTSDSDVVEGKFIIEKNDSIKLILPNNYISGDDYDMFYPNGYDTRITETYGNAYSGVGIVRAARCRLYDGPDEGKATKSYIVRGDMVYIEQTAGTWMKIVYVSWNANTTKRLVKWIKANTLFDKDPMKWEKAAW